MKTTRLTDLRLGRDAPDLDKAKAHIEEPFHGLGVLVKASGHPEWVRKRLSEHAHFEQLRVGPVVLYNQAKPSRESE